MHVHCRKFRKYRESEKKQTQLSNPSHKEQLLTFHVVAPFKSFFMLIVIFLFIKVGLRIFSPCGGWVFFFLTQHILSSSDSLKNILFNGQCLFFVCILFTLGILLSVQKRQFEGKNIRMITD